MNKNEAHNDYRLAHMNDRIVLEGNQPTTIQTKQFCGNITRIFNTAITKARH
jgi:hypothetical protein